jgi:hypothetical protein
MMHPVWAEVLMKTRLLALSMGAGLLAMPLLFGDSPKKSSTMSDDMRRAIAFERYKDVASARQARKEAVHPSVTYTNADRSADRRVDESTQGKPVKDPGPGHRQDQ